MRFARTRARASSRCMSRSQRPRRADPPKSRSSEADMKSVERILFAVKDPDSRRLAGIGNAADLARKLGATLELFHAISTPVFLDLQPLTGTSLAELKREALALRRKRLEKLAALARKRGAKTTCHVEWD